MHFVLSEQELRQFAQELAGRSSVPFIKAHPSLVMPEGELLEGVNEMLKDRFGIDPPQGFERASDEHMDKKGY